MKPPYSTFRRNIFNGGNTECAMKKSALHLMHRHRRGAQMRGGGYSAAAWRSAPNSFGMQGHRGLGFSDLQQQPHHHDPQAPE